MKTIFLLKNIDTDLIDKKYNFKFKSNINIDTHRHNTTDINELNTTISVSYNYLDESKKKKKCSLTMKNLLGKTLPKSTNIHCYWCKHSFKTCPIGCPIKFVIKPVKHYQTDGIFCSFNCCLSFINDNTHKSIYEYSLNFIKLFHQNLFGVDTFVKPAPDWRLLNIFGGDKTIEEFRSSFDSIVYDNIDNYITCIPDQLPISWLYNENLYL